jgi:hypothetical protein
MTNKRPGVKGEAPAGKLYKDIVSGLRAAYLKRAEIIIRVVYE